MRLPEPSFYTLEALAEEWKRPLDVVKAYVEGGQLAAIKQMFDGEHRRIVTPEERRRFEGAPNKLSGDVRRDKLETAQFLLGQMLAIWHYGELSEDAPYVIRDQIEGDGKAKGLPALIRTRETDANVIRECLDLLRARGWRPMSRATSKPLARAPNPAKAAA